MILGVSLGLYDDRRLVSYTCRASCIMIDGLLMKMYDDTSCRIMYDDTSRGILNDMLCLCTWSLMNDDMRRVRH